MRHISCLWPADVQGRIVLLFQPAEERGAGARAVLSDPLWLRLVPKVIATRHHESSWTFLAGFSAGRTLFWPPQRSPTPARRGAAAAWRVCIGIQGSERLLRGRHGSCCDPRERCELSLEVVT